MEKKKCPQCSKKIEGRTDKVFCSILCKNSWNYVPRQETKSETAIIDGYLHRNREILDTLMGNSKKEFFDKIILDRTGFRYEYITGVFTNAQGKQYHYVYNFAWMRFSDQQIMVVKKK
jgi:hypothetical protein